MCGRFTLAPPEPTLRELIGPADWRARQTPRWNIAPGQDVLAVTLGEDGGRRVEALRWGFPAAGRPAPLVNVRAETAAIRSVFRSALVERRCILPADAFYEWQGKGGQPYRVAVADGRLFGLAAIRAEAGGFAILTREATPSLAGIHHRMPVMLEREAWRTWLGDDEAALAGDVPEPPSDLVAHPVSRRVNSVLNDDPACAEPVAPEERQMTLW